MKLLFLLGAVLLSLTTCYSQTPTLDTRKVDNLLTQLAAHQKAMGSLAITRNGQLLYSKAFGAAQVQPLLLATPATRYRTDYMDRIYTEVLLFQLIEEGKLTLATPLAKFFPQLPNAQQTTIDYLRTRRAGLGNALVYDPAHPLTQRQVLARLSKVEGYREIGPSEYFFEPNYLLLQFIIEKLTGQPYAQALQQRVVKKAGLEHTYFTSALRPRQQEALLYEFRGTGWQPRPEALGGPLGQGTLVSTPTDLNRFLGALYEGRLLSTRSRAAMQQGSDVYDHVLGKGKFEDQLYYVCTADVKENRSIVYYFPQHKLTVALCLNGLHYDLDELLNDVLRASLGKPYALPTFAPPFVPNPASLAPYLGTYQAIPLRYTVVRDGATLRLESVREGNETLDPISPGVFRTGWGNRVEFSPDGQQLAFKHKYGRFVLLRE
jgi:D-alanyl-D-alanine carboxypeptidase